MEGLSKSQHDEYATAFAILALYDGGVRTCIVSLLRVIANVARAE
jgi:hypothetical protein